MSNLVKTLLISIGVVLGVSAVGFVGLAVALNYFPTQCMILGDNICNYDEVLDLLEQGHPSDSALFEQVMIHCGAMFESPKKEQCYRNIAWYFDGKFKELACQHIQTPYRREQVPC